MNELYVLYQAKNLALMDEEEQKEEVVEAEKAVAKENIQMGPMVD
jgi:hypothetical protein